MRKLFLSMAAVAALLASCSKDETTTAAVEQRSMVTFTVNAPELSTRADNGDGTTATQLEYVIYDLAESAENGANQITGTAEFQNGSLTTTVEVPLVEDRKYEAIFFASAPDSPYKFDYTAQTMTITNPETLVANNEEYDAFFKFIPEFEVKPTGTVVDVKMTRPFAQLNIGTNDFDTQAGQMIDAEKVQVKVSKVYKTLNLKSGAATEETDLTFAFAPKMDGTITASGNQYAWLSMNYLLVNDRATEKTAAGTSSKLIDVEFSFTDAPSNDEQNPLVRTYTSVPVERNYRTNIVGSILTSSTKFNVEILPGFEDDKEGVEPLNVWDGKTYDEIEADANGWYSVSHAAEFAWILQNLKTGMMISLEADIDFGGHQLPTTPKSISYKLTINGNGNTIYNFKDVYTETRSTDFRNVGLFPYIGSADVSNLNIKGATVDAGKGGNAYAGVLFGTTYGTLNLTNIVIEDCEVMGTNKIGGLVGNVNEGRVNIDNCHVVNTDVTTHSVPKESGSAGGFIGFINQSDNIIKNSSVQGGTLNFIMENPEEGDDKIKKRANSKFIGVVGNGKVELINCTVDVDNYTNDTTDCNNYVSPYGELVGGNRGTATVVIDGVAFNASADGDITVEDEGETASVVATSDSLVEALESGENVYLTDDIKIDPAGMSNAYGTTGINVKNGQTINGNGNTLDIKGAGGTWDSGINTTGGLIKNITVTGSFRGIFINHNSDHSETVVLQDVTIKGTTYTISCDQGMNQGLEAYNSTFKGWTSFAATLGTAKFDGCYFGEGNGYAYCRPYAPTEFVGCEFEAGFELDARAAVTFENCTLGGQPLTAENLATLVTSNIANASVK